MASFIYSVFTALAQITLFYSQVLTLRRALVRTNAGFWVVFCFLFFMSGGYNIGEYKGEPCFFQRKCDPTCQNFI